MRFRFTLLTAALLLSPFTQAKNAADLPQVAAMANETTAAGRSTAFVELENQIHRSLLDSIKGESGTLTRSQLEGAGQGQALADKAWLKSTGYDFAKKEQQQAGIALLETFSSLPKNTLRQNLATVETINLNATSGLRQQALVDAEGQNYLFFLADALGPRLGQAFIRAYNKGELSKAAALIKASEVSTSEAKKHFGYPRPFLIPANTIHLVPDSAIVKDNHPYTADGGAFPSGHTNTGYTDALLMAQMVPERFVPLVDRAARYGYSRVVLGVHYPLDVMGSRMVAQRNLAHYLNDPQYRSLFDEAKRQLRTALEKECGMSLSACAKVPLKDDPYAAASMQTFYRFTLTYNLPRETAAPSPLVVPQGAEVLLEAPLPHLSAAQRRQLMVKTALAGGYPLSGNADQSFWQRLNLHDAVAAAR
ncbi:acid phosphatase [Erwinia tasmaniensis]|uniref:Phosphatase n=1 Tax=Erwinia tasmaniensis (strain DSM 17950 / CFBP 7177 / CIP 109463 / NCPPB 4357 / Et1/99) TaxID=465817 RepID=B2VGE3_ERWT9|nr:phosphatase PAP2 family protein [Erwinia tasmaniensis]CAO95511.1 Putative phosphatase [Erwinia tasmaniensis Et1/99]